MLRRKQDNTFEFRDIERMLYSIQPPALTAERKDALRLRIMASLGEQDEARRGFAPLNFRERWIAVPAGAGLAAAILAGAYIMNPEQSGTSINGTVTWNGVAIDRPQPGQMMVAVSNAQVRISANILVSMDAGARFSYAESGGNVTLQPLGGRTMVTTSEPTTVAGSGWSARMGPGSTAVFEFAAEALTIEVPGGVVVLSVAGMPDRPITEADGVVSIVPGTPAEPGNGTGRPVDPTNHGGDFQPDTGAMPGDTDNDDDDEPAEGAPPSKPGPSGGQGNSNPWGNAGGQGSTGEPGNGQTPGQGGNGPAKTPETPAKPEGTPPAAQPTPQGTPGTPPDHAAGDPPAQPPANPGGGPATPETPVGPPDDLPGGGAPDQPGEGGQGGGEQPNPPAATPSPGAGNGNGNGPGSNNGNGPGANNGNGPGSNSGSEPGSNSGNGGSGSGNGQGSSNGGGQGANNGNGNKHTESSMAESTEDGAQDDVAGVLAADAPEDDDDEGGDRRGGPPGNGHAFGRADDKEPGPPPHAAAGGHEGRGIPPHARGNGRGGSE